MGIDGCAQCTAMILPMRDSSELSFKKKGGQDFTFSLFGFWLKRNSPRWKPLSASHLSALGFLCLVLCFKLFIYYFSI